MIDTPETARSSATKNSPPRSRYDSGRPCSCASVWLPTPKVSPNSASVSRTSATTSGTSRASTERTVKVMRRHSIARRARRSRVEDLDRAAVDAERARRQRRGKRRLVDCQQLDAVLEIGVGERMEEAHARRALVELDDAKAHRLARGGARLELAADLERRAFGELGARDLARRQRRAQLAARLLADGHGGDAQLQRRRQAARPKRQRPAIGRGLDHRPALDAQLVLQTNDGFHAAGFIKTGATSRREISTACPRAPGTERPGGGVRPHARARLALEREQRARGGAEFVHQRAGGLALGGERAVQQVVVELGHDREVAREPEVGADRQRAADAPAVAARRVARLAADEVFG